MSNIKIPLSNTEFANNIRDLVENGQGFVPLIGSGISAPSGILMGQDFTDFLAFTVAEVISEDSPWDMRRDGWPKYPAKDDVKSTKDQLLSVYRTVCKRHDIELVTGIGEDENMVKSLSVSKNRAERGSFPPSTIEAIQDVLRLGLNVPLIPDILCHRDAYQIEAQRRNLYQQVYRRHPSEDWQPPTLYSPSSIEFLQEKAIRSLHDWRATLAFLASVSTFQYSRNKKRAILVDLDPSVIDSFNVHITRNKKPNLSHLMVARLVRPLRSRVLLTTNFDSLLEESFAELNEPMQLLEVSSQGHLPAFHTVRAQNCLIKLHGGLSETRADFSLDEPPNREDKNTFTSYLCGGPRVLRSEPSIDSCEVGLQHMLVMGYSGRDQRTIQLVKSALDSHPDLRLFWICHSKSDADRLTETFEEDSYYKSGEQKIYFTIADRPDLLLYELYQKITRSLPGGGFSFQYSPNVPPDYTRENSEEDFQKIPDLNSENVWLKKSYIDTFWRLTDEEKRPRIIRSISGVISTASLLFKHLNKERKTPLWMELEDYVSPLVLLYEILQIISLKLGHYQLDHANLLPPIDLFPIRRKKFSDMSEAEIITFEKWLEKTYKVVNSHVKTLIPYLGFTPENWPIFLYGRNGAGGCAGFSPSYWNEIEFVELQRLMQELVNLGFPVIYFPYDQIRSQHDVDSLQGCKALTERVKEEIGKRPIPQIGSHLTGVAGQEKTEFDNWRQSLNEISIAPIPFDMTECNTAWKAPRTSETISFKDTIAGVTGLGRNATNRPPWIDLAQDSYELVRNEKALRQIQFLYAVTLFRQSRHATALVSEATYQCPHQFNLESRDNDKQRYEDVEMWVQQLQNSSFLLTKPGGYNWCFRDVRLSLQSILEDLTNLPEISNELSKEKRYDFLGQTRARTHFWIGHWYQKAFASTGHYIPLIEAIFHMIETARYAPFAKPGQFNLTNPNDLPLIYKHRQTLLLNGLNEAGKTLRMGRNSLKFWLPGIDDEKLNPLFLKQLRRDFAEAAPQLFGVIEEDAREKEYEQLLVPIDEALKRLEDEFECMQESLRAEAGRSAKKLLLPPLAFDYDGTNRAKSLETVGDNKEPEAAVLSFLKSAVSSSVDLNSLFDIIERYLAEPKKLNEGIKVNFLREEMRKWRAVTSESLRGNSGYRQVEIYSLIWGLSELAYNFGQKAKYYRFKQILNGGTDISSEFININLSSKEREKNTSNTFVAKLDLGLKAGTLDVPSELSVLKRWSLVSALCWSCIELCRGLRPEFATQETALKVKCYTLYGLSLSYLNRFSEAHRRLNEAHALIPLGRSGYQGHDLACLHLRRAELYLNQAEREFAKGDADKVWAKFFAHIDDGWVSLERAENALSGFSHSSTWWGQLDSLKLRTFSLFANLSAGDLNGSAPIFELAKRTMPFRRRLQHDELVKEIVHSALLTYNGNTYREYRICWYYSKIEMAFKNMKISSQMLPWKIIHDAAINIKESSDWSNNRATFLDQLAPSPKLSHRSKNK